jgi:hypothetical protein
VLDFSCTVHISIAYLTLSIDLELFPIGDR